MSSRPRWLGTLRAAVGCGVASGRRSTRVRTGGGGAVLAPLASLAHRPLPPTRLLGRGPRRGRARRDRPPHPRRRRRPRPRSQPRTAPRRRGHPPGAGAARGRPGRAAAPGLCRVAAVESPDQPRRLRFQRLPRRRRGAVGGRSLRPLRRAHHAPVGALRSRGDRALTPRRRRRRSGGAHVRGHPRAGGARRRRSVSADARGRAADRVGRGRGEDVRGAAPDRRRSQGGGLGRRHRGAARRGPVAAGPPTTDRDAQRAHQAAARARAHDRPPARPGARARRHHDRDRASVARARCGGGCRRGIAGATWRRPRRGSMPRKRPAGRRPASAIRRFASEATTACSVARSTPSRRPSTWARPSRCRSTTARRSTARPSAPKPSCRARDAELEDLRAAIYYEVRGALLDLDAARELIAVGRSGLDLAPRQLEQARNRFAAGVASNLEVVEAQESLARADETFIASLYLSDGRAAAPGARARRNRRRLARAGRGSELRWPIHDLRAAPGELRPRASAGA